MSIEVNATEQIIEVNATGSTIDINVSTQTVDVNATTSVIDITASYNPGINLPVGGATGQVLKKQSGTDYDMYWGNDNGVPYIGATGDVDLGEYELKAGQIELDQTPTGTAGVAVTRWNDTIGSTETTLKGGNVILKNGVDLVARVVNKVTPNTTLTKAAYQAVKISGAQGQRLAVALAQANNDNNSADTLGLVTETIPTNQEGFIMTVGSLEGINTTGSLQGETWSDGDVLYLSPTTPGAITKVKPNGSTGHIVVIGYVEYAHQNNGKIYVKIMNGWELSELHDTFISSPTNNDALIYESATSLWKNKSIATALGYTPVPSTRSLTINGTAYDLTADRTWSVGTVTSVDLSVPTGLVVTGGSPITTSGTIAIGLQSGYSIPTTVKQGNWDDAYTFVSNFPSQTGNSGKYLTTDGSTLSWGTVSTANIYNSDGTLTGNRTVNSGGFSLTLNPTLTFGDRITGVGNRTYTSAFSGSTSLQPSSVLVDNIVSHTGASSYQPYINFQNTYFDHTGSGGNNALVGWNFNNTSYIRGLTTGAFVALRNIFLQSRNDASDVSTNSNNYFEGLGLYQSHFFNAGSSIYTNSFTGFSHQATVRTGSVGSIFAHNSNVEISRFTTGNNSSVTNYYAYYSTGTVGTSSGPTGSITNYYGIYFNAPTINATGTITNRWGVYAPDGAMKHHLQGNLILGGTVDAGFKLDVQGTGRVTGNSTISAFTFSTGATMKCNESFFEIQTSAGLNVLSFDGTCILGKSFSNAKVLNQFAFSYINDVAKLTGTAQASFNNTFFDIDASGTGNGVPTNMRIYTGGGNILIAHNGTSTVGRVGIGTASPNTSALLDVASTTKGFLQPRMTGTQRDAIVSPATGLSVYNTTTNTSDFYNGTSWVSLAAGNIYTTNGTLTADRTLTHGGFHLSFVGGTFTNRFTSTGRLLLGTTTESTFLLDVNGTGRFTGDVTIGGGTAKLILRSSLTFPNAYASIYGLTQTGDLGVLSFANDGSDINFSSSTTLKIWSTTTSFNRSGTSITSNTDAVSWGFGSAITSGYNFRFYGNIVGAAGTQNSVGVSTRFDAAGGTNIWRSLVVEPTLNMTGGTTTFTGILFNPTVNTSTGLTLYAFHSTNGGAYFNTSSVAASAILQADSVTKGFLPPRMTSAQRAAISTPATGLIVYQTDGTEGLYENTSTGWRILYNTPSGGSGITRSVNNISTTTTAAAAANTDYVYLISGTTTLTLPTAVGNTNRYTLKNVGTGTVTINTTSSQTIDGSTSITMAVRYTALDVISDGTNWNII